MELDAGYLKEMKTFDSQLLKHSLLEANRSTINHESHHDQHDYDPGTRKDLLNTIPQLSSYLLGQITHRLELQSKVLDHKLFLELQRNKKDPKESIATSSALPPDQLQEIAAPTSGGITKEVAVKTPASALNEPQLDAVATNQGVNKDMSNENHDMKCAPKSTAVQHGGIKVFVAPDLSSQKQSESGKGLFAVNNSHVRKDQTLNSLEGGGSRNQQLSVSFRQETQRQDSQHQQEPAKFLNEMLFTQKPAIQKLKQEPQVVQACAQYTSSKNYDTNISLPTSEAQQQQYHTQNFDQKPNRKLSKNMKDEFWRLQQLVSMDSSIITDAQN